MKDNSEFLIESSVVTPLLLDTLDNENIYPSMGQVCTWSNEQWAAYHLHRSMMHFDKPYLISMRETSPRRAQRCWLGPLLVSSGWADNEKFRPNKHTWDIATLAIYLYTAGSISEKTHIYHTQYCKEYYIVRSILVRKQRDAAKITCIVFSRDILRYFYIYHRYDMSFLLRGMAKLGIDIVALRQDVDEIMRFLIRKPASRNRMNSLGQWDWRPPPKKESDFEFVFGGY